MRVALRNERINEQVTDRLDNFVVLKDIKPSGTAGGSFNSGDWRTRDLNAIEFPSDTMPNFISLPTGFDDNTFDNNGGSPDVSKQRFNLIAGRYKIKIYAPSRATNITKARLYNFTDSQDAKLGQSGDITATDQVNSIVSGELTIEATKTFEVQHQCNISAATNGFGFPSSFASVDEIYTIIEITKLD